MKKTIRLTETDLVKIVKRIVKEQFLNNIGTKTPMPPQAEKAYAKIAKQAVSEQPDDDNINREVEDERILIDGASAEEVQELLENLPESLKFLAIINCEGADFSDVDICSHPNIILVNLRNTPNNFREFTACNYEEIGKNIFDLIDKDNLDAED